MSEEMRVETMELCVTACEKFATNNEVFMYFCSQCYSYCFTRSLLKCFLKMKTFKKSYA